MQDLSSQTRDGTGAPAWEARFLTTGPPVCPRLKSALGALQRLKAGLCISATWDITWEDPGNTDKSSTGTSSRLAVACSEPSKRNGALLPWHFGLGLGWAWDGAVALFSRLKKLGTHTCIHIKTCVCMYVRMIICLE